MTKFMLTILGISTAATLLGSWILNLYWNWFMVTSFGVDPLTFHQALGVGLMWAALQTGLQTVILTKDADIERVIFTYAYLLGLDLVLGFLWHVFAF